MSLVSLRRIFPTARALQPHFLQTSGIASSSQTTVKSVSRFCDEHSCGRSQVVHPSNPVFLDRHQLSSIKSGILEEKFLLYSQDSPEDSRASSPKQSDKPTEEVLQSVAKNLTISLERFFVSKSTDFHFYRKDLIFENRITGETIVGWPQYHIKLSLLKIVAHLKFIQVRLHVHGYSVNTQNGYVRIRWSIRGLGMVRYTIYFFPKKLYRLKNALENAIVWHEGISYYYVDGNGLIYRHVLENKEKDREKTGGLKEELKKKVMKLSQKPTNPAPI